MGLLCILAGSSREANAQEGFRNLEYRIKAGYFAYFGGYIQWPDSTFKGPQDEFVIGVLGWYPFEDSIQEGNGGDTILVPSIRDGRVQSVTSVARLNGRPVDVRRYGSVRELEHAYKPCHVLFVCRHAAEGSEGETLRQRLDAAIRATRNTPVLIIAEAEHEAESKRLAELGAVITYWNDTTQNRVRMFINRSAEKEQQLSISAQLLRLSIVAAL